VQAASIQLDRDFVLGEGARIAGTVALPAPGYATIQLVDAATDGVVWSAATDNAGQFLSPPWLPGSYYVTASAYALTCQAYLDAPCPAPGESFAQVGATALQFVGAETHAGIDFFLQADVLFRGTFE
jgi:hypothetical protein